MSLESYTEQQEERYVCMIGAPLPLLPNSKKSVEKYSLIYALDKHLRQMMMFSLISRGLLSLLVSGFLHISIKFRFL